MSELLIPITSSGKPHNISQKIVGKVTTVEIAEFEERKDYVFVSGQVSDVQSDFDGYSALVTSEKFEEGIPLNLQKIPLLYDCIRISHITDGDIISINPRSGFMRTLYRVNSRNNVIFATDRCNSLCLMCSQPPKKIDDSEKVQENLRMIALIDPKPELIGISGGEPTLLKDGLFLIMRALEEGMPDTFVNMLTNGRMSCYEDFAEEYASIGHPKFCAAIPLYSDIPDYHDHIVQAKGAFSQTVTGIYNLAFFKQMIEIRVVIHRLTYKRLPDLAKFIYKNFPFVAHVALMGLEIMGYTKKNLEMLWIDPVDYQKDLYEAVEILNSVGIYVSIYNHQLCVLKKELWPFERKSISDYKNLYLDECQNCSVRENCGGLFKSAESVHSKYIKAV